MQTIYKLSNFEWISRPPIEVDNITYIVWRSHEVAMTIESWANLTKSHLATKYYGNYISLHLNQICVIFRNGIDVIIAIRWMILNVWIECLARITLSTLCYVYILRKLWLWCDTSFRVYYVAHRLCVLVVETIGTVCIDWFWFSKRCNEEARLVYPTSVSALLRLNALCAPPYICALICAFYCYCCCHSCVWIFPVSCCHPPVQTMQTQLRFIYTYTLFGNVDASIYIDTSTKFCIQTDTHGAITFCFNTEYMPILFVHVYYMIDSILFH